MKIDYKEKKLLTQDETAEKEVVFMVEETKLQLQSDVLATKRDLEKAKAKLASLKNDYPLNPQAIIEVQLNVESLEDGLKRLENLSEELGF